jgi:hypothetical protein
METQTSHRTQHATMQDVAREAGVSLSTVCHTSCPGTPGIPGDEGPGPRRDRTP